MWTNIKINVTFLLYQEAPGKSEYSVRYLTTVQEISSPCPFKDNISVKDMMEQVCEQNKFTQNLRLR